MRKEITKILAVRNDRFGEFLLNIPAFRAIKETYPEARLTVAVDPYLKELAGLIPYIDNLLDWPSGRHSLRQNLGMVKRLRKEKFDLALILNPSRDFNLIAWLAGIPERAGYAKKLPFLLTKKIADNKFLGEKHEVEYNLELAGLVGAKTTDLSLTLKLNDDEAKKAALGFGLYGNGKIILLHPWTSDPVKQWKVENFFKLAKMLLQVPGLKVLIIGAKEYQTESRENFGKINEGLSDLTGKTSLKELAYILKAGSLLISADSGPAHLAAAVGTPVIALFRNDLPGKTAKRWRPWGQGHTVIEQAPLDRITPEEVFNRVKEVLQR